MVTSATYPGLERKPGGPDNWVERAKGLPKYIERIAKHLHYERGFTISHAIATAKNTVERWARGGTVTKYGTTKRVSKKTQALAAAAVASWNAKRIAGRINLSDIDLSEPLDEGVAFDLLRWVQGPGTSVASARRGTLRTNIAVAKDHMSLDLASTIAPRRAGNGKATDGRRSYKKQGKWGHGFVPLDKAAKEAKAKGSPIAEKRLNRLYKTGVRTQPGTGRAGGRSGLGRKDDSQQPHIDEKGVKEKAQSVGRLRNAHFDEAHARKQSTTGRTLKETSKQTRIAKRARQNWNEIPANLKTVRNGKRFVLAAFGGKNVLTEWIGGINQIDSDPDRTKTMRSISAQDLAKMTPAQIRKMLANPRTPDDVRKLLNAALRKTVKEALTRG